MAVPPPSKRDARRDLAFRRQAFVEALGPSVRQRMEAGIAADVDNRLGARKSVAAYFPIGSEIDPRPLMALLKERGAVTGLPHVVHPDAPMRFLSWSIGDACVPGPYGLQQPPEDADEIDPEVIIAPLLGFDAMLNRLGMGAGYYDRAFARHPSAHRIGLAWSVQRCDSLPVDPWDIPLHAVVTERDWIA